MEEEGPSDLRVRAGGAVGVAAALGVGWWFVRKPWGEAVAGADEITYFPKALFLVALGLVLGPVALIGGAPLWSLVTTPDRRKLRPLGTVLVVVVVAIGVGGFLWFEGVMADLGYD